MKEIKEKRFFCDLKVVKYFLSPLGAIVFFLVMCILVFFSIRMHYGKELKMYSYSKIYFIESVCDYVIEEGKEIHLSKIPDDIENCKIEYHTNKIYFSYNLKERYNFKFAPKAQIRVVLSNDYKILSKEYSYHSDKEYHRIIIERMIIISVLCSIVISGVLYLVLFMIYMDSKIIKEKWIRENVSIFARKKWD